MKEDGLTIVFTTHEPEDALLLADTVGLLKQGQLLQEGHPETVYHQPQSADIARLLGPYNEFAVASLGIRAPYHWGFRPSAVRLDEAGHHTGTVTRSWFHGTHYLLEITLEDGTTLLANHHEKAGGTVHFTIREDWVVSR